MAGAPSNESPASGYLLQTEKHTLLLDCGPGVVAVLAKLGMLHQLTAVFISHRHADHCADLTALAYARLFPDGLEPIPLYGPADLEQTLFGLDALFGIPSLPSLRQPLSTALPFTPLSSNSQQEVLGLELHTHKTQHPVETFAYNFPELGFVYTADGSLTQGLIDFARGCHTLLAEATYLKDTRADLSEHGHMTSLDAATLAKRSNAKRLVLTHFSRPSQLEQTLLEAKHEFDCAELARPLVTFHLPPT
jgi:ribonuclease BN (tRNA processing enzyme)